jgi:hypothetical protein
MALCFLLPGNGIQRKWKKIRDSFRKEVRWQKEAASEQGARKRRKHINFDQLLFLLSTMQERVASHNITLRQTLATVKFSV